MKFFNSRVLNFTYIQGASLNRPILLICFSCFVSTGDDAGIAILLPTVTRFICIGALDWGTTCFVISQGEFRREFVIRCNRAVPSEHAIKTWVRTFEANSSIPKKMGGSVKTERTT